MLHNDIQVLQNELNQMLLEDTEYSRIYETSVRLDELIVQYYKRDKRNVQSLI
ncbi:MAG: Spo0E family sporulation regulatory protein-aspartic acid phosphatase [Clostridia bacterium]|nr:Spo0E family sporulation regulatory protein-aspartic acid phosphatase [Clostridia bacterium]